MENEKSRVPDILAENLDLLIVGFNPSLISWKSGHHYANPVNNFYRLLYSAGLTPRLLKPEEDVTLPQYGIGSTNFVVDVPSANESAVPAALYRAARVALDQKIEKYQPLLVCFNGLKLYNYYFGLPLKAPGLQAEKIANFPLFVVPSTSGAANKYQRERIELFKEMKNYIVYLKGQQS